MVNTLKNIIARLEKGSNLETRNQNFSNEILFHKDLQCTILGVVNLFEDVDFTESYFVTCTFENCTFENIIFRKCEF